MAISNQQNYENDFYAWAMKSADLLRQKKFSELDIEHLAEEIESMDGNFNLKDAATAGSTPLKSSVINP